MVVSCGNYKCKWNAGGSCYLVPTGGIELDYDDEENILRCRTFKLRDIFKDTEDKKNDRED